MDSCVNSGQAIPDSSTNPCDAFRGVLAIGASFRRAETRVRTALGHTGCSCRRTGPRRRPAAHGRLDRNKWQADQPPGCADVPDGNRGDLQVRRDSDELTMPVSIPAPRSRKQPYAEPEAVVSKRLSDGTGYLKVTVLPGLLGLDVARSIDRAVEDTRQLRPPDSRSPRTPRRRSRRPSGDEPSHAGQTADWLHGDTEAGRSRFR